MASAGPNLKGVVEFLQSKDVLVLSEGLVELQKFLQQRNVMDEPSAVVTQLLDVFGDALLKHVNYKVALSSLRCLGVIIDQMGGELRAHFNSLIDLLIERLGDRQQAIRDHSLDVILRMMRGMGAPTVFDRLRLAAKHKNPHVREHYMICFMGAVTMHGADSLSFGAFLPHVVKLLSDPAPIVREAALQVLDLMMRYVGSALIPALERYQLKPQLLQPILERLKKIEVLPDDQRVQLTVQAAAGGMDWNAVLSHAAAKRQAARTDPNGTAPSNATLPRSKTPTTRTSARPVSASGSNTPGGSATMSASTSRTIGTAAARGTSRRGQLGSAAGVSQSVPTSSSSSRGASVGASAAGSRSRSPERGSRPTSSTSLAGGGAAAGPGRGLSATMKPRTGSQQSELERLIEAEKARDQAKKFGTARPQSEVMDGGQKSISSSNGGTPSGASKRRGSLGATLGTKSESVLDLGGELNVSDDVKPANITSDKQLRAELATIAEVLKDVTTHSWTKRIEAMRTLEGLVLGGASEADFFLDVLYKDLRVPITVQVQELRSTVCKEACTLVCFLSRQLRNDFTQMADYLVPVLFKLTYVSISVISEAGNLCIQCVLQNTRVNKAILAISQGVGDRNDMVRFRCTQYLLLLLESNDQSNVNKAVNEIEAAIRRGVGDKTEDVRAGARSCYWAFHALYPERAERMLPSFDSSSQKLIFEMRKRYADEAGIRRQDREREHNLALPMESLNAGGSIGKKRGQTLKQQMSAAANAISAPVTPRADKSRSRSHSISASQRESKAPSRDGSRRNSINNRGIKARALLNRIGSIDPVALSTGPDGALSAEYIQDTDREDALSSYSGVTASTATALTSRTAPLSKSVGPAGRSTGAKPAITTGANGVNRSGNTSGSRTPTGGSALNNANKRGSMSATLNPSRSGLSSGSQTPKGTGQRTGLGANRRVVDDQDELFDDTNALSFGAGNGAVNRRASAVSGSTGSNNLANTSTSLQHSRNESAMSINSNQGAAVKLNPESFGMSVRSVPQSAMSLDSNHTGRGANSSVHPPAQGLPPLPPLPSGNTGARSSITGPSGAGAGDDANTGPVMLGRTRQSSTASNFSIISDASDRETSMRAPGLSPSGSSNGVMMPVLLHPGARSGAVSAVLVQGRSQNPVARLKAFEQLEEVLRDSIAVPDVLISLEKLVTLFQDRLVDVNVKVAEKALSVLLDLLRCVKLKIVPHLDKLVPNIFLKLADAKPSIRQLANAALVKISQDFGGDTLYPVILRVLEIEERAAAVHASNVLVQQQRQLAQVTGGTTPVDPSVLLADPTSGSATPVSTAAVLDNSKVTTGCLEFLHHLISQPLRVTGRLTSETGYFKDPSNVHDLVVKVHPFIYNSRRLRLRDIAVSILVQVIDHHNAEALYAELLTMPPAVAAHVLPPVEKFLPDLSQRLAAYAQQHPEVLRANTFSATPASHLAQNLDSRDASGSSSPTGSGRGSMLGPQGGLAMQRGTSAPPDILPQWSLTTSGGGSSGGNSGAPSVPISPANAAHSVNSTGYSPSRYADDERAKTTQAAQMASLALQRMSAQNMGPLIAQTSGRAIAKPLTVSSQPQSRVSPAVSTGRPSVSISDSQNPKGAEEADMENLASSLTNVEQPEVRTEAIRMVALLAQTNVDGSLAEPQSNPSPKSSAGTSMLDEHFDVVCVPLLECLDDANVAVKELALQAVCEVLAGCPKRFTDFTYAELTTLHLLEVFRSAPKDLYPLAERGALLLANACDARSTYGVLLTCMEAENRAAAASVSSGSTESTLVLHAVLRMLQRLIERMGAEELTAALPRIVPELGTCLQNPNAIVRKDVVTCFVAIHAVLGDRMEPFLSVLKESQVRLIKIYISRAAKGHALGMDTQPSSAAASKHASRSNSPSRGGHKS